MSDRPPPLWFDDEHDAAPRRPSTAAQPWAPPQTPPPPHREMSAGSILVLVFGSFVALVIVGAIALVLFVPEEESGTDTRLDPNQSAFSTETEERRRNEAAEAEERRRQAAASAGPNAGKCATADVVAPFEALQADMPNRPAGEMTSAAAASHVQQAGGQLEVRRVTVPGEEVIAAIVSDVEDAQVFITAFVSGERNIAGPAPRQIDIDGRQGAFVPLDGDGFFTNALVSFLPCRAVLVFGSDETAMANVSGALLRGGGG